MVIKITVVLPGRYCTLILNLLALFLLWMLVH